MFEKTPFGTAFDDPFPTRDAPVVAPTRQAIAGVVEGTDLADIIGPGTIDADGDEVDGAHGLNDVIDAGAGDDTIDAGDGDDTIIGGAGADEIDGGDGTDFIDFSGSSSAVTVSLIGGSGSRGDAAGDTYTSIEGIIGTEFNDRFIGLSKKGSVIFAGDGNDFLSARGGSVEFYGEAGDDFFQVDNGRSHNNAIFDGGEGFDQFVFFGTPTTQNFRDDVFTGFERLDMRGATYEFFADQVREFEQVRNSGTLDIELNGATGIDLSAINFNNNGAKTILRGGDAAEGFVGSEVADTILAGDGDDILDGGLGSDTLTGEAGADTFVFSTAVDDDTITDFTQGEDLMALSALIRDFDAVTLIAPTEGKVGFELLDSNQSRKKGDSSDITISVAQDGADAVLTVTSEDPVIGTALADLDLSITLEGVDGLGLTLDDFIL